MIGPAWNLDKAVPRQLAEAETRKEIDAEARLRVEEPIERCAATNVDPDTATRDMNIPMLLVILN